MKYYVNRFYTQINAEGGIQDKTASYIHYDKVAAMKQYYKLLSADIDDANKPYVLCIVIDQEGVVIARQRFNHAIPTPVETAHFEVEQ